MKKLIVIAAISGMLAVILGAFGAHALKPLMTVAQSQTYETAVKYQFVHTLAILCCAILVSVTSVKQFRHSAYLFSIGILLFSGSLYLISLKQVIGIDNLSFLGPLTPVGGMFFIAGWVWLLRAALKTGAKN